MTRPQQREVDKSRKAAREAREWMRAGFPALATLKRNDARAFVRIARSMGA